MSGSEDNSDCVGLKPEDGLPPNEKEESKDEPLQDEGSNTKSSDSLPSSEAPSKEPEFELMNPPDLDEITGDSGSILKSGGSSLGSYADVSSLPDSPGVEATMEHADMKKLLHEAGKESGDSSTETEEHSPPEDNANLAYDEQQEGDERETPSINTGTVVANEDVSFKSEESGGDQPITPKAVSQTDKDADVNNAMDLSTIQNVNDTALFSSIMYLGSSTVNAPVSDVELKRTMAVLKEQSRQAVDIILSVGSTHDSSVKLIDPQSKIVIATYELQKILFCGRGDAEGDEKDCFAFNICHGNAKSFHCHVFRCLEKDVVSLNHFSCIDCEPMSMVQLQNQFKFNFSKPFSSLQKCSQSFPSHSEIKCRYCMKIFVQHLINNMWWKKSMF